MRYNFKIPAALCFILVVAGITRAFTYTPGDPYSDVSTWLPTVAALFGSALVFYVAHLAGLLDWLDRS